jgi:FAD:protein FMN transferase
MRFLVFFLVVLILTSCQGNDKRANDSNYNTTIFTGNIMTIDYKIIVGKILSPQEKVEVASSITAVFNEINTIYNKWNPDSELSQLNRLKAGVEYPLSPQLERFLQETQKIVALTEGRFDPTIEPLQQLWKEKLQQGKVPTDAEIADVAPAIGWDKIHFNQGIFRKDHDETSLDLGGIAKGFTVDRLIEELNAHDYPHVYVEWGGEIRTSGHHPEQRPWNIFISHFGDINPQNAIAHLSLSDQAIATSGDYLQNWSVGSGKDGVKPVLYFHVFDPHTLQPLKITQTSIASASVLSSSCFFADALATAAMTFSTINEAKTWAEKIREQYPNTLFWLVSRGLNDSNNDL